MNSDVYYKNDSWYICIRKVNIHNFSIEYIQEGGYHSQQQAIDAKNLADEKYKEEIDRIKKKTNIRFTFTEYIVYWLNEVFLNTCNTVTRTLGIWTINNIILPNVKNDVLLSFVTPDYINDIIERCRKVCESSGEMSVKYLRNILKSAYNYGYLSKDIRNDLIKVPRQIPHIEILTHEELKKLLEEASKHPGYYLEILLATFAGLRSGEVRGLKYSDFNKETQTLRISRQYTNNYHLADVDNHYTYKVFSEEKAPKGSSYRLLKIPAFLFDELEKRKVFNEAIIKNRELKGATELDREYVSISAFGVRKAKGTLTTSIRRVCRYASVPEITFHALRHQFATLLLEEGVPLDYIAKLMGHKSVMTSYHIYCGISEASEHTKCALDNAFPSPEEGGAVANVYYTRH